MLHFRIGRARLSLRRIERPAHDGEVRTIHPTQVATAAFFGIYDLRRMIALGVQRGGKGQNVGGAKFDAEAAALASLDDNADKTLRHLVGALKAALSLQHVACQIGRLQQT